MTKVLNCIFARMNSEELQLVKELLSEPRSIVITPHKNPDGDAIGSSLALWHYLRKNKHDAHVIVPNDFPKFLKWMPGVDQILIFDKKKDSSLKIIDAADLIFTLDFNDLSRIGDMQPAFERAPADFVMIDHHQEPQNYARITYSDVSMSSTCEMVYNFIEFLDDGKLLDENMAQCLYAGILTDTGSFKYPSTSSRTHKVVANLIDKGINSSSIQQKIFDTNTPDRLHLLGRALNNLVILNQYSTAYIVLLQDDLDEFNYKKGDTEGFVNYGLTLEGIRFAVIFIENGDENYIKISFRSQGNFSVNEFARNHFNGGGHTNAAGGRSDLSMDDTIKKFLRLLEENKEQLV